MASKRVAVVTGANKGIGFEIVKGLCQKFDGIVYLTARNETMGIEAVNKLKVINIDAKFHQLDVDDQKSCDIFRAYVQNNYGGIDVLVNNAAIYFNSESKVPLKTQAEETIKTNYFGLLRVCNTFFDLLRPKARVVHISSSAGHLSRLPSEKLREKFSNPNLSIEDISHLMNNFVKSVQSNQNEIDGWGNSPYVISKIGVSALAIVQQIILENDPHRSGILVNSVHPGYVKTDMTNRKGEITPVKGAETPIFLALLPENEEKYKGAFVWNDKRIFDWFGPNPKTLI